MRFRYGKSGLPGLLALFLLLSGLSGARAANGPRPADYGADLELGGAGNGNGKFAAVADMAFDKNNVLYVLDTVWTQNGQTRSNYLAQRFSDSGQFLSQFSIYDSRLGANNAPAHLAVDSQGNVYITQPRAGLVQQYNAAGVRVRDFTLPAASAIAIRSVNGQEQILVLPQPAGGQSVQQVSVFYADGRAGNPIPLGRAIANCLSLATDANGGLYALADINQVYKFAANGALLTVLGSGVNDYYQSDGSALLHTVAVDSKGSIYSTTPHNPGYLTKFSADLTTETQRAGLFSWCDAWGYYFGRSYTPVKIDRKDRVWVGVNGTFGDGESCGGNPMHFRPCLFRTAANFLDAGQTGVTQKSLLGLGLLPTLAAAGSATGEFHTTNMTTLTLNIAAATRRVSQATLTYSIYDVNKKLAGQGKVDIALQDGVAVTRRVTFQPPKWGWYEAQYTLSSKGTALKSGVQHLAFTPSYSNVPNVSDGEIRGGPVDAARQAEVQLKLMRTGTNYGLDAVDRHVADAAKYGLTLIVELVSASDCAADKVREAVTRFKGRVRYWEVVNEPNLSMSPQDYVALLQQTYRQIKNIDPQAQIVAPALCGIDLNWYQQFYQLGGKSCCDVLSLHDYEGNGSIDPYHWTYKIRALRQIMASYGDQNKPVWQTELAISGVQGGCFMGGVQAVRMLLHRDLLETLGISADTNLHFYANEHGFSLCPSYLWSGAGPHPAAAALRVRSALLKGRTYSGTLDFGATGNKLFFGLKYPGPDGSVVYPIHNLGLPDSVVNFRVAGGATLKTVDAFGNVTQTPVIGGVARITVPMLPVYLVASAGQTVAPVAVDFGTNVAGLAQFTYSEGGNGNFGALTNGVMESIHAGSLNPNFWVGNMPAASTTAPTLTVTFPTTRSLSKAILYGINADNQYCALLAYDAQVWTGTGWTTVASVNTPCPASDAAPAVDCLVDTWYMDQNTSVAQFPTVTTSKIRFVIKRVTAGFTPDALAASACHTAWGADFAPKLMLREVEIY